LNALELASGVIVTGFNGTRLGPSELRILQRAPFAGYILFARNLEDVGQARALTDALRAQAPIPPILSIDQEGGRVMRLRAGVEPIPPMMALGALGDTQRAFEAGEAMAHDLRRAGCTLDFAPVLDLALEARNTVIGTRAFGTSVELVSQRGSALASGLDSGGITATFKHFPGHGATALDTHVGPARLDSDEATLRTRDLAPFAACLRDDAAIMAAHVAVPAIDGDRDSRACALRTACRWTRSRAAWERCAALPRRSRRERIAPWSVTIRILRSKRHSISRPRSSAANFHSSVCARRTLVSCGCAH
jgi:beta-N-acetylhexosaminidase